VEPYKSSTVKRIVQLFKLWRRELNWKRNYLKN